MSVSPAGSLSPTLTRARVYLVCDLSAQPTWAAFNAPGLGLCNPDRLSSGANPAWFLPHFAGIAADWGLDGALLYHPGLDDGLYRLTHRTSGVEAGARVCDGAAILNGLVAAQAAFEGDFILYRGQVEEPFHPRWFDLAYTRGVVEANLAPWFDASGVRGPVIRSEIEDGSEIIGARMGVVAVRKAVDRRWPLLKGRHGCEGHPLLTSGGPYFSSLTMRTLLDNGQNYFTAPNRVPPETMPGPTMILERCFYPEYADLAGALDLMRQGRSYAVYPFQVGFEPNSVTGRWAWRSEGDESRMREFVRSANAVRDGFEAAGHLGPGGR